MTFGEHIRKLREQKQLLLREVASQMHIDTALLSKIERGTRIARKEQVEALAIALKENKNELLNVWMADKIVNMLKDESNSTEILKKVEEEIKNLTNKKQQL
ncbi:Helix-turn-helix domain-containing protein [Bizionia echini]|uniref:Helix-turn-helix domain-containing protein n=2 Tax=Bizionia echini TaxID=649333 RepID=A0A1I5C1P7_9FLAO|nr:Helix-turn-helix domain-containing protein [Bizionia echini]